MPVQNIGSEIISAFLAGRRLKEQREARDQDLALRQQQLEESTRQFNEQIAERQKQFQAENKLRQAQFDFDVAKAGPAFSQAMIQGLIPSQRRQTGSIPLAELGTEIPIEELFANIPGIGERTAPTPEAFAQTQRTLQRPATDEAIRRTVEAFQGTLPGRRELVEAQGAEQRKTLSQRDKQQLLLENLRSENALARDIEKIHLQGFYRLQAAQIARQNRDIDPDDLSALTELAEVGDAPLPAGKLGAQAAAILQRRGKVPVKPQDAQGFRNDVAKAQNIIQQLESTLEVHKNKFGGIAGKTRGKLESFVDITEFGNQINRLKAQMGNLASTFGGESGARLSDADRRYMEAFQLNPGLSAQSNQREINKLKTIVTRTMNTKFGNLKPEQRQRLFDTSGVSYLKSSESPSSGEKKVKNVTVIPD